MRNVSMPLYFLTLLLAMLTTALWWRDRRGFARGRCAECGYDLAGIASDAVCPECGLTGGESSAGKPVETG